MTFDKAFIKAVAKGKLELLKQLTPEQAFILVKEYEAGQTK
ncbi:hypothetical protein NX029_01905 [Cytobacillus firmus]|nr:hypothetical protein [Cytobacillus oceanisediminis]MCS0822705.1 hypothetical protein [Cytobacillus firmus]